MIPGVVYTVRIATEARRLTRPAQTRVNDFYELANWKSTLTAVVSLLSSLAGHHADDQSVRNNDDGKRQCVQSHGREQIVGKLVGVTRKEPERHALSKPRVVRMTLDMEYDALRTTTSTNNTAATSRLLQTNDRPN
jgi:hypothetical protein